MRFLESNTGFNRIGHAERARGNEFDGCAGEILGENPISASLPSCEATTMVSVRVPFNGFDWDGAARALVRVTRVAWRTGMPRCDQS